MENMNPVLQEAIRKLITYGLALLAGYLVKKGIWSEGDVPGYLTAGTALIFALGLSFWASYKSRKKLVTALTLPAGSTENDVIAKIAAGPTPTVFTNPATVPGVPIPEPTPPPKPTLPGAVLAFALLIPLCFTACKSTLAPGGAYAPVTITTNATGQVVTNQVILPDLTFYTTESAFLLAVSTLDIAFNYERDNRVALWKLSPAIKQTLDSIRPDALATVLVYKSARVTYLANPTPTGLTLLNTVLAKIQQFSVTAQTVVTKTTTP